MIEFLTNDRNPMLIGTLLYACAALYALTALLRSRRYSRGVMLAIIAFGFAWQSLGLIERGYYVGRCPLSNAFEILQFITWAAVLIYLVVGPAYRMSLLGLFTSLLAALLGSLSFIIPGIDRATAAPLFGGNPWVEGHAALAIFSYGVFGMLAATSVMYLLQNYALRAKNDATVFRVLPSVLQLDEMNRRLLRLGVGVLTVSILVGLVFWLSHGVNGVATIKFVATVTLWGLYLLVILLHSRGRLVANRFAWVCVGLFAVSLLTLWPIEASRLMLTGPS